MSGPAAIPVYSACAVLFWLAVVLLLIPALRTRAAALLPVSQINSSQQHLPGLDALRGLAALLVAVFHTWQWTQPAWDEVAKSVWIVTRGDKAVPVFVALSGLLIYRALQGALSAAELRTYLLRRFLRIFPVYAATVIVAFAVLRTHFHVSMPDGHFAVSEIFMLRALNAPFFSNPQSWSLYVEVLFYVLLPWLLIAVPARRTAAAWAGFAIFAVADAAGPRELGLWKYFFIGIIAAEWLRTTRLAARRADLVALCGLLIVVYDFYRGYDWIARPLNRMSGGHLALAGGHPAYTLSLGVGMLLLLVGVARSGLLSRLLETPPLRALGAMSYSVFMWHSFLIAANFPVVFDGLGNPLQTAVPVRLASWMLPLIVIPAVLAAGALSYLMLERPFMLLGRRKIRRP